MKCGVDPATALAEEHLKLVRDNFPEKYLRDKGQLHVREMLEKESGEHAVLSEVVKIFLVQRCDVVSGICAIDKVTGDQGAVIFGLDAVHGEATWKTGDASKHRLKSFLHVM